MIEYDLYEKDEIIRNRTMPKKPRTKKSNHKHDYEFITKPAWWSKTDFVKIEICKICQREGKTTVDRDGKNE